MITLAASLRLGMNMNVLMYSHDWAPSIGGTQKATMTLARGIAGQPGDAANVSKVTLVTQTPPGEMYDCALPFAIVRRPSIAELIRLITESDVVHLAGPAFVPMLLARIFRKKYVIQHHNYQAVCPNGTLIHSPERSICPNHFLNGRIVKCLRCQAEVGWIRGACRSLLAYPRLWLARKAQANVAVSDYASQRLDLPASRTIYNGTQSEIPEYASAGSSAASRPCVAFVGRLVPDKGIAVLIGAAMELAEQRCEVNVRIIGDGPERGRLEGLVRLLELRHVVTFSGFLQRDALARATAEAIAIVKPSLSEETAGLAAIEQMMRGKLVIASDIGGLSEVVGPAGLKFEPGNPVALAERIREALEDPEMRIRLGAAARERALALFTAQQMVNQHLSLYNELAEAPEPVEGSARLIRVPRIPFRNSRAG